jgi:Ca-activated chloride channel family protein
MKTEILLDHEPVADGGWLLRTLLKIEGTPRPPEGRVPLNLSIVLDRSGSMMGGKLEAAKEAARGLVQRLWPDDVVSVVTYDDQVEVVAIPETGERQTDLTTRIAAIEPGGSTNLSGGWLKGRELVALGQRESCVNRVLLLTDGLANVGITEPETLTGLCQSAAEKGISTTAIGFGAGYDEALLTAMATAGGGNERYIEHPDQAAGAFDDEFEDLASISAQNLSVRIEPTGGNENARVWHEYPSHVEGDALVLTVGDLYAREPRHVLAEFLLKPAAEGEELAEIDVATFTVRAEVVTPEGLETQTVTLPLKLSPVEGGRAEATVRKEMLHIEASRARKQALAEWEKGEYGRAQQRLRNVGRSIMNSPHLDAELREEAEDLDLLAERSVEYVASEADRKYMHHRAEWAAHSKRKAAERVSRVKREQQGKGRS